MKRTFKRPDGTEETLEGTAEELAEYERKLKREQQEQRPDILKGAPAQPIYIPYHVYYPVYQRPERCWVCGAENCHQTHIWCGTATVDLNAQAKFIEEHPEWDWSGLALGAGGKIPLS